MNVAALPQPEVRGVCIVSRKGQVVGTIPAGISEKLARKIAKAASGTEAKDEAAPSVEAATPGEDPF